MLLIMLPVMLPALLLRRLMLLVVPRLEGKQGRDGRFRASSGAPATTTSSGEISERERSEAGTGLSQLRRLADARQRCRQLKRPAGAHTISVCFAAQYGYDVVTSGLRHGLQSPRVKRST